MKLNDDKDFGGPLNAAAWVCVLMIPICFLAIVIGSPAASAKAQTVLMADFGLLGSFIALKTMAISRRARDHDRGEDRPSGGGDG